MVVVGNVEHHTRLVRENAEGALSELKAGRHSNVGLLAIKALEQAIEACAAKGQLHFHEKPKTSHTNRRRWLKRRHPDLVRYWDELRFIYGALGYGGTDGESAEKAARLLRHVLSALGGREGVELL